MIFDFHFHWNKFRFSFSLKWRSIFIFIEMSLMMVMSADVDNQFWLSFILKFESFYFCFWFLGDDEFGVPFLVTTSSMAMFTAPALDNRFFHFNICRHIKFDVSIIFIPEDSLTNLMNSRTALLLFHSNDDCKHSCNISLECFSRIPDAQRSHHHAWQCINVFFPLRCPPLQSCRIHERPPCLIPLHFSRQLRNDENCY